jgi:CubicO group peptidase (beta-lactamase class C family)
VDALARVRLIDRPGTVFRYGSIDYNVAARVAEVAGGQPYRSLVQSRVLAPLGMRSTDMRAAGPGLPDMVGELWTTPRDFVRFLGMVLGRGRLGDVRVLSEAAIDEMERGQNGGLPKRGPVRDFRGNEDADDYGLGMWRSRVDDGGRLIIGNTVGRGGFAAWIDLERGVAGVLTAQPSPLNAGKGDWHGLVERLGDAMVTGRL